MKLFNTLTRYKEDFKPITEGHVKMYACGPTVYNYFHLGNARPFVTFDTLRRYLEYRGYEVEFCQNFTDIDDKMINRAKEEGVTVKDIADKYIAEYYVELNGDVDAIVFTAGVGENGCMAREDIISKLNCLGININKEVNDTIASYKDVQEGLISSNDSKVDVYVIPTNEELMIIKDTYEIING